MKSGHLSKPYPLFLAALLFFLKFPLPLSMDWFSTCSAKFSCGIISDVDYPFWGGGRPDGCGHPQLKLNCDRSITTIQITNVTYDVLNINQSAQTLRIKRADWKGICSPGSGDTAFKSTPFQYAPGFGDIFFVYNCAKSSSLIPVTYFTCPDGSTYKDGYALQNPGQATETGICNATVTVGIDLSFYGPIGNSPAMERAVREGFEVEYDKVDTATCRPCTNSGGVCVYNSTFTETVCFCNQSTAVRSFCNSAPLIKAHKPGNNPETT